MIAIGQSAGGHLVSLLGTRNGVESPARVAAVVNFYGPTVIRYEPNTTISDLLDCEGRQLNDSACDALALDASPYDHVDATDPPFLNLHGLNDTAVPYTSSVYLHGALVNASVDTTLLLVHEATHSASSVLSPNRLAVDPTVHEPQSKVDFTLSWIEDHAWCAAYVPPSVPPQPPPQPPPSAPPVAPPCADDPESVGAPADACDQHGHWLCGATSNQYYEAFRSVCQLTCGLCTPAAVEFELAQASASRALSEAAAVEENAGSAAIERRCGADALSNLSCVQAEIARLLQELQVEGLLTVTESGSLSGGDWSAHVRLIPNEQCAATIARVLPQATRLMRIVARVGVDLAYQVGTCSPARRHAAAPPAAPPPAHPNPRERS